jgi:tetratricopeptide (TPR) repeat protein
VGKQKASCQLLAFIYPIELKVNKFFRAALQRSSKNEKGLFLGVLLEDAGEPECAIELFSKALAREHDLVEAHVRLGCARWQLDDSAGMYESFSEAVRIDPQAVRIAALDKPEEARLISLVLYPNCLYRWRRIRDAVKLVITD